MIWLLGIYAAASTVAAVWLAMRFLTLRARYKRRNILSRWPISAVALQDFDPVFSYGEFGPGLATEIAFISAGDKGTIGGTSDLESWVLAVLAKRSKVLFEFGTCTGRTTYHWARNSPPDARIYTITLALDDHKLYRGDQYDDDTATKDALLESRFSQFLYTGTPVAEKIRQLFGDSKAYDESELTGQCDLIFIDGSHAYSYVRSDTEKALRMVRPGGIILWHDYTPYVRDVYRYLNELAKTLPLVHLAKTHIVAYRAPMDGEPPR